MANEKDELSSLLAQYGNMDEKDTTKNMWKLVNMLYSDISHMINYKYHRMIYTLVKKDYIDIKNLEDTTGYSKQRIYQIVNAFEEKQNKLNATA